MTYDSFVASLANLMVVDPATPEFEIFIPDCIQYSEKRIYRELDVIDTVWMSEATLTPGNRLFVPPPARYGSYITYQGMNIVIPNPLQRIQLQPVSLSYLNAVWGTPNNSGVPHYFGVFRQDSVIVGQWPDKAYTIEVLGTYRPEPLSATHPETYLTQYLPDLFLAASVVFASGYMKDFGSQADAPQQSQSWENQYQLLSKSANLETLRQKYAGPGWTSLSAIPIADSR